MEGGYSADRIDEMVARKYEQSLKQRGDLIARTEIARASIAGNQALWEQALAAGYIDDRARQRWYTEPGPCPECEDLEGAEAKIGEEFEPDGGDGPPLHPACRCTLRLIPVPKLTLVS